ncbi:MAG: DUF1294 domain-containing protein [Bacillota bacterium]|jgi:uncharacterized membrane protein YsdA (DUF1294 family)
MANYNLLPVVYAITINTIGFFVIGFDKMKAKSHKWRVPERRIFLFALMGGALGIYSGMKLFRHKTKHRKFTVGIPLLIFINVFAYYLMLKYLKYYL